MTNLDMLNCYIGKRVIRYCFHCHKKHTTKIKDSIGNTVNSSGFCQTCKKEFE